MTEAEVIQAVREHFESLFPKVCSNCGWRFAMLREYILNTEPVGPPTSYDADLGDWESKQLIGTVAQANCACGSTLALGTTGMPMPRRLALLNWLRTETQHRSVSPPQLLEHLRTEVRNSVLSEPI